MAQRLFVDTSVWFAAANLADVANERAKLIIRSGDFLIVSDHVLVEAWRLIRSKVSRQAAERFWEGIRSGAATVEHVGPQDLEAAWQIGLSFPDQDFSIVDRTSFALMLRLGIERVASFDHHFAVFRFGPNRRRTLTLVR